MSQEIEVKVVEVVPNEALSLLTKAELDVQISTAKAFPRSLTEFSRRAESMVSFSQEIAESCTYSVPRGGENVTGKSVRLAEIVAASYGNIKSGARVISNDGRKVKAQGICHDLETNNSVAVEVERSILQHEKKYNEKTKKYERTGRMVTMSEDMQIIAGNAACSIAYRNAVFKVIPSALSDSVWSKAKEVARGTVDTLPARRTKALSYFKSIGVTDDEICNVLQIKKVEDIDIDRLVILTGYKSAINNNEATIEGIFRVEKKEEITIEQLQTLLEEKVSELNKAEFDNAKTVIDKKQKENYKAIYELLKSK